MVINDFRIEVISSGAIITVAIEDSGHFVTNSLDLHVFKPMFLLLMNNVFDLL